MVAFFSRGATGCYNADSQGDEASLPAVASTNNEFAMHATCRILVDYRCRRVWSTANSPAQSGSRKLLSRVGRLQWSLASLLTGTVLFGVLLVTAIRHPTLVVIALLFTLGVAVVGLVGLSLLAEGLFWEWLAARFSEENSDSQDDGTGV